MTFGNSKLCTRCKEVKPLSEFANGTYQWCKSCCAARAKEHRAKERESLQVVRARYVAPSKPVVDTAVVSNIRRADQTIVPALVDIFAQIDEIKRGFGV